MNFLPPDVLETPRLRLRRPERDDVPAIFEYASDPEVTRLMDWRTHASPTDAVNFIENTEKGWASGTEFTWVIALKPGAFLVGAISYSPHGHHADIGYVLNRRYWGRGYATEAADHVMKVLFDDSAICRAWATCDVDNLASARVLEKIGMAREGRLRRLMMRPNLDSEPHDCLIYAKVRG
jgi:RimJ/RimL family protein N-acetyltransferase